MRYLLLKPSFLSPPPSAYYFDLALSRSPACAFLSLGFLLFRTMGVAVTCPKARLLLLSPGVDPNKTNTPPFIFSSSRLALLPPIQHLKNHAQLRPHPHCSFSMMVGRYNNKHDPLGLNAGFANPDPKYENWQPAEDYVPKAGNKKDSRFVPDNMWATATKRPGRPHMSAYMSGSGSEAGSSITSPGKKAPASRVPPKLDGSGDWRAWGVDASGASPYLQEQEKEKRKENAAPKPSTVPRDIEGMNRVLAERAKDSHAKTAAAYANGTAPHATEAVPAAAPVKLAAYIPPHERKKMGTQTNSASALLATTASLAATTTTEAPAIAHQEPLIDLEQELGVRDSGDRPQHYSLRPEPVYARPAPGTHFKVSEHRRPSSITLVNGADEDDEALARRLQAQEFNVDDLAEARHAINEGYAHYKAKVPSIVQVSDLYHRLHKVQELLWKQEVLNLPALNKTKDELLAMRKEVLEVHFAEVESEYLHQWNLRAAHIQEMLHMEQAMRVAQRRNPDDYMKMGGPEFAQIFEKVSAAFKSQGCAVDANRDQDFEDDRSRHDFDLDALSQLEFNIEDPYDSSEKYEEGDSDYDDDADLIMFRGRR
ncbi:hypothetical protein BU23DRAFT_201751 [Bimuria novae-zelandiae CBS 107.79]|uniref:Uncharacterized protein n=1 Tax=Bimuria novae-zelandiae CBS 107.79 TaxID=1447943 RepID=A0A6A5V1M8_9PLEO|nr:hypothetical protein BU23DRAFT_201751 [Bimuria novae-zelandiae CBS 107.79]